MACKYCSKEGYREGIVDDTPILNIFIAYNPMTKQNFISIKVFEQLITNTIKTEYELSRTIPIRFCPFCGDDLSNTEGVNAKW